MSKTYLFIFISIAFSVFAHGQSLKDSLIAEGNRYFDKSHDFWDISNFDSCFYYTSKSLSSFKKAGSFDDMVKCYNGLSSLSGYQGRFKMQKEYIDSALSYVNNDTITINSAVANYNLAGYLESVHLLEEAENRYTITTQFAKDLQLDSLTLHTLHNNLSHLYFDLKNYKSSIDEIELAINILKDDNNFNFYKVRSLINKANIYSEVDKINEAFDALNTAELISRNHIQDNKFEFEIILERSKIHFKNQNYNECLKTLSLCNVNQVKGQANYLKYLRLLTLSKIKLSIDLDFENEYVDSLNKYPNRNINHLQEYYGEIAIKAANKNINKAVKQNIKTLNEITSTFKKNLLPSNVAYQLAKLNQSAYQLKVASVIDSLYSEKEIDFFCNQLISAAYQLRRISYFSYVKTEWTEKIEELLPSILNLSFHQKISDIVLIEISELIKQRNANDRNALLTKAKESKLFNEIKNIEALIAKYEEFNLSNNNKKQIEENRTVIIGLRNDLRTKIKSYKNKFPDIYDKLYTKEKITISEIQKNISSEDLILNYLKSKEFLCVCNINKNESSCNTIKFNDSTSDFQNLFSLLKNGNSSINEYKQISNKIYRDLLEQYLKLKTQKLIIIPHGSLSYLPFHALVNNNGNFVINDCSINYQLNLNLLLSTSKRKQSVIDGVNIFTETTAKENSLLCSEKEISAIHQSEVKIDEHLDKLLNEHDEKKILHVIAHASSSNEELSGEISEGESMLSGLRIKNGNIKSDLIILSSCESGVGVNTLGEGVSSLNSAIFHNDIGASISALWKIDDCSTAEVLSTFYKNISKKRKDEALRTAMLDFLNDAHPSRRHPHYWAGLVQYGNTERVRFENEASNYLLYIVGLLICFLLAFGLWSFNRKSSSVKTF